MKRLLIPAFVLVLAIIIWILQSKYEKSRISGKLSEDFLEISDNNVTGLELIKDIDSVFIYKENDTWYIKDFTSRPVDIQIFGQFLEIINNLSVDAPVSNNPDRQTDYLVDDINGNILNIYEEDEIVSSLIVGKMSSDFTRAYIRKPGSNDVFTAPALLSYAFNVDREQWADKTITSTNLAILDTLEVKGKDDTFKFLKTGGVWKVSKYPYNDTASAKMQYANPFLRQAVELKGIGFLTESDRDKIDFREPIISFTLSRIDGIKETVEFTEVKSGELGNYYCRKLGAIDTILISKSSFDALYKSYADFLF